MKNLMVAAVAALAVAGAQADAFDPNAATTLKMVANDNGALNSFTNFNNWTAQKIAPQLMDEGCLAQPNPAAADYDYYVTGHTLRSFKAPPNPRPAVVVFGGKSLRFGSSGVFQSGGTYAMFPLSVADLHFGSGSAFYLNCDSGLTNSTITVDAEDADYPWKILNTNGGARQPGDTGAAYTLALYDCKLIGSANARMRVMPNAVGNSSGPTTLYYRGDGSGYLGQIEVSARNVQDLATTLKLGKNTDLGKATVNIGLHGILTRDGSINATVGTVNLTSDSGVIEFVSGGKLTVKNFVMSNGGVTYNSGNAFVADHAKITGGTVTLGQSATVNINEVDGSKGTVKFHYNYNKTDHVNGCVNITDSFVGPVTLEFDANFAKDNGNWPLAATVFTVKKSAFEGTLTADAFRLSKADGSVGHLPRAELAVEEDAANDCWNVKLLVSPYVQTVKKGGQVAGLLTTGEYWSDGEPAHDDADYCILHQWYTQGDSYDFSACMKSLTLNLSGGFWPNTSNVIFPDETVLVGNEITTSGGTHDIKCKTAAGCLEIPAGKEFAFRPYGNSEVTFNFLAPLVGGGTIALKNRGMANPGSGNVNFGSGVVNFKTANPNFLGKIDMTCYGEGMTYPYTLKESTKFGIAEPESIGGTLAAFTADALRLSYYGTLKPLRSMTLPETSNRGIWVDWAGRILVDEGMTVNVNNRLTFSGTWEKLGAGTLFLGASVAPAFRETAVDTSKNTTARDMTETDKKGLVVTEGALGATTKTAVEGLAVNFKSGATLAADANATGDAAKYGLYNKTGSVTFEGGTLKVRVLPPTERVLTKSVAVLTVPNDQAGTFEGKLVAEKVPNYTVAFSSAAAEGEDGMTTFTATLESKGLMIILK